MDDQPPQSILKKSTIPTSTYNSNHARRKSNTSRSIYDSKGRRTFKSKIGNDSTMSSTRTFGKNKFAYHTAVADSLTTAHNELDTIRT